MNSAREPGDSSDGMRKSSIIVLLGSITGFAISFLLTPVLSRLFSPEEFGLSSAIVALASVFVGVSTLRLEVIAQRVPGKSDANGLLRAAFWINLCSSAVISLLSLPIVIITNSSLWWLAVGPLVFFSSWQLIGAARLTRDGKYQNLAGANFAQGATLGTAQVTLGLLWPTVGTLICGYFISRLVWLQSALVSKKDSRSCRSVYIENKRNALQAGTSALINSFSTQALPLLISVAFGQTAVGLVAMAIRVLVAPLGIVAQAVAASAMGHVGAHIRESNKLAALKMVKRAVRDQALLGAVPCLVIGVVAPFIAVPVLGEEWASVGTIVAIMSFGAWAQFIGSPFAQILNITSNSNLLLRWDLFRLIFIVTAVLLPAVLGHDLLVSLFFFSIAQFVTYGLLLKLVFSALDERQP